MLVGSDPQGSLTNSLGNLQPDQLPVMLTVSALAAADSVLIPVQAGYLPVNGLKQLLQTISKVQRQSIQSSKWTA